MKINRFLIAVNLLLGIVCLSCDDNLEIVPPSTITPENYLKEESQLDSYMINLYPWLPNSGGGVGLDNGTDNEAGMAYSSSYTNGDWKVESTGGEWNFEKIYQVNYFLEKVLPLWRKGEIQGDQEKIKHYIGEAYFFRALAYFERLVSLGDFPIVRSTFRDDMEQLVAASKRMPRNEVARFIISDLDSAAMLLSASSPDGRKNRLYKDIAYLYKSRVGLFEGTWLKYFKGTAFVPNGEGWLGATKDYNQGYEFPSGSIDNEIQWFLDQSIEAAALVADKYGLTDNTGVLMEKIGDTNPYVEQFSALDMSGYDEILLWRDFDKGKGITHNRPVDAGTTCYGIGLTRSMIQCYLLNDGLPYYKSSLYMGDNSTENVIKNRDDRIRLFLKQPNMVNIWLNVGMGTHGTPVEAEVFDIVNGSAQYRYNTGYQCRKYWYWDHSYCNHGEGETGVHIFRVAEAYLNYMEAYYERYGRLDSKADQYWRKLRMRAHVSEDYNQTILATNMEKEAELDWGAYSAGKILTDATLFNIRRERRCEFLSEGLRMMDLKRWRAMDQMKIKKYHIEGFKLWNTDLPERYKAAGYELIYDQDPISNVSSPSLSDYLRPYEILKNNRAYEGYGWHMAHYLNPIAMQHFMVTSSSGSVNYSDSPIYQNPYWPVQANLPAEQ